MAGVLMKLALEPVTFFFETFEFPKKIKFEILVNSKFLQDSFLDPGHSGLQKYKVKTNVG